MVKVQVLRCMAWLDYDEHVDSLGMDKTKITRKPSKTGKHKHEKRRSVQESEAKVKKSQPLVNSGKTKGKFKLKGTKDNSWDHFTWAELDVTSLSHWSLSIKERTRWIEDSTRDEIFYTLHTHDGSTNVSITDCHAGNPCEFIYDLTVEM
ncbi:hypothetical protein Tco_1260495 [Tanacetum coccineum]